MSPHSGRDCARHFGETPKYRVGFPCQTFSRVTAQRDSCHIRGAKTKSPYSKLSVRKSVFAERNVILRLAPISRNNSEISGGITNCLDPERDVTSCAISALKTLVEVRGLVTQMHECLQS